MRRQRLWAQIGRLNNGRFGLVIAIKKRRRQSDPLPGKAQSVKFRRLSKRSALRPDGGFPLNRRSRSSWRAPGVVLVNTTYRKPLEAMIMAPLALALRYPFIEPMMFITKLLTPLAWIGAWQSYFSGSAHLANRIAFGKSVTRNQLNHTSLLSTRNSPGHQAQGNLSMFRWDATRALTPKAESRGQGHG